MPSTADRRASGPAATPRGKHGAARGAPAGASGEDPRAVNAGAAGAASAGDPDGLAGACELVGDRWSLPLVAALLAGPRRYGELQRLLPGIAPNILSARLRTLEREGVVVAERYSARPQRFAYRLSPDGRALGDAATALAAWGARHAGSAAEHAGHEDCGTPLELRWWCPSCEVEATPPGAEPDAVL